MIYHLYIDAPIGRYNILELSFEETETIVAAYINQEREFEFRDQVYDFRELNDFQVIRSDDPDNFSSFRQSAREEGRIIITDIGELMSLDLLLDQGIDVTEEFFDGIDVLREDELAQSELEEEEGASQASRDLLEAVGAGIQSTLEITVDGEVGELEAAPPSDGDYLIDIYISHSRDDIALTAEVVTLIRSAFNLHAEQIRCTSLPGFTLPRGMSNNQKTHVMLYETRFFIGLVTPIALHQGFVMFEGGARWGKGEMTLVTFNTDDTDHRDGPLHQTSLLNGTKQEGLRGLIKKIQHATGIEPEPPRVYARDLRNVLRQIVHSKIADRCEVDLS